MSERSSDSQVVRVGSTVRQADIARALGVSQRTVSTALSDDRTSQQSRVGEELVRRIRKFAAEMNYVPNQAARVLKGSSSGVFGVITGTLASYNYQRLALLETYAAQRGLRLMVSQVRGEPDQYGDCIYDFRSRGVDGVLALCHDIPGRVNTILRDTPRVVYLERPRGVKDACYADIDFGAGIRAAVERFDQYQSGSNFVAWVLTIARYKVLDYYKARSRDRHVFDVALLEQLEETHVKLDLDDQREALQCCLGRLQERARHVLELRYQRNMSPLRIGEHIGASANSVAALLYRVRRTLAECIQRRLAGGERA